jgi:hypothetical protein
MYSGRDTLCLLNQPDMRIELRQGRTGLYFRIRTFTFTFTPSNIKKEIILKIMNIEKFCSPLRQSKVAIKKIHLIINKPVIPIYSQTPLMLITYSVVKSKSWQYILEDILLRGRQRGRELDVHADDEIAPLARFL